MLYSNIFFDLDDTLYSSKNGLWEAIRERMGRYMLEKLGLPADEIPALRRQYFETYGTTLRGLQIHYQVDAEDYLTYVHDLPLEQYLRPLPVLRNMLLSLPQRRWIFTNASAEHADRVLKVMALEGCFDGIIDLKALQFVCKPDVVAYQRALVIVGEPDPHRCVLIDDRPENLSPAHQLGFTTVLVNIDGRKNSIADWTVSNLLQLPRVMPELWDKSPQTEAQVLGR